MDFRLFEPDRWERLMYPRTLGFLGILATLLVGLSILVRIRATLQLDIKSTLALQQWSNPLGDGVMKWLTWMGNSKTMVVLAVGIAIVAVVAGDTRAAIFVLASLLALPINILVKNIFDRERPGEKEVKVHPGPRWGFSYPSGHAMGSTTFYGFLAVLVFLNIADPGMRWGIASGLFALPLLVGISRVYLGAHWMSDVVGGIAAGVILIAILAVLYPI